MGSGARSNGSGKVSTEPSCPLRPIKKMRAPAGRRAAPGQARCQPSRRAHCDQSRKCAPQRVAGRRRVRQGVNRAVVPIATNQENARPSGSQGGAGSGKVSTEPSCPLRPIKKMRAPAGRRAAPGQARCQPSRRAHCDQSRKCAPQRVAGRRPAAFSRLGSERSGRDPSRFFPFSPPMDEAHGIEFFFGVSRIRDFWACKPASWAVTLKLL